MEKVEITVTLVKNLIQEQFPEFAHLEVKPVEISGNDNRSFRLGDEMLIRLPSSKVYAPKVVIEQKWLPILANHLSIAIPKPLALGKRSKAYPWNWSIYCWLEGESANCLILSESTLENIALDLARFLNELHNIDTSGAPESGPHNFFRGSSPSVYDKDTRAYIKKLEDIIDTKAALSLWEKAISFTWNKNYLWVHGDLASGNILVRNKRLSAVIDFGGMSIGDPACDLTIAWTFFKNESRRIFKQNMNLDEDTWTRARGWALWKAMFELCSIEDKSRIEAIKQKTIISELISECEDRK